MRPHLDDNEVFDLLEGLLTPDGARDVQQHIDVCNACRKLVAEAVRSPTTVPVEAPAPADRVRIVVRDGKVSMRPATPAGVGARRSDTSKSAELDLVPGRLIAERYRLDRRLGEGGSGVVWAATHAMMRREVALKFLKNVSADAKKRFLREARVSAAIRHPNIVSVHDVFMLPEGETPVMVMDLLHGESLGARLRRGRALAPADAAQLLLPVVMALGAAHELGIIHRDLKPENIFLVGPTGAPEDVRVLDFGLAKLTASEGAVASTTKLTRSGVVMGTPHYMAPEQLTPDGDVDRAADVWALGVILYQAISGKRPFDARGLHQLFKEIAGMKPEPLAKRVEGVPRVLSKLVEKMLDKKPAARPRLSEVHDALSALAPPDPVSPRGRPRPPPQ